MKVTLTKYCIMTEDLKEVEVGLSRAYHFAPLEDVINEKCKSPIKLFKSFNVAKSSFEMSFGVRYNDETKRFEPTSRSLTPTYYVIKEIKITYDINL